MNKLGSIAGRIRIHAVVRGTAVWFISLLVVCSLLFAADIMFHMHSLLRAAGLVLFMCVSLLSMYILVIRRMISAVSASRAARFAEEQCGIEDNILINWVQLREKESFAVRHIAEHAARALSDLTPARVVPARSLLRHVSSLVVAVMLSIAVSLLFPEYIQTSFKRFIYLNQWVEPVSDVRLEVFPGDCTVPAGGSVDVTALEQGDPADEVYISITRGDSGPAVKNMAYVSGRFAYRIKGIRESCVYQVTGGDFTSRPFTVTVTSRPSFRDVRLTIDYPPSLKWKTEAVKLAPSESVSVPPGSGISVSGTADRPLASAAAVSETGNILLALNENGTAFSGISPFIAEFNSYIELSCTDRAGVSGDPFPFMIRLTELRNPEVRLLKPGKNIAVKDLSDIDLLIEARDLYGIENIELAVRDGQGKETVYQVKRGGTKKRILAEYKLPLDKLELEKGKRIFYEARVYSSFDRLERGSSAVYSVRFLSAEDIEAMRTSIESDVREKLMNIISRQRIALQDTRRGLFYIRKNKAASASEYLFYLERDQKKVSDMTSGLLSMISNITAMKELHTKLDTVYAADMQTALAVVKLIQNADSGSLVSDMSRYLAQEQDIQVQILKKLNSLLKQQNPYVTEESTETISSSVEDLDAMQNEGNVANILKNVETFIQEEKEVIDLTSSLIGKDVDDLTDDEKELFEKLKASQEKWSEYFRKTADEIAKLYEQDFADSSQADECIEAYSEIEKAAEELVKGNFEIAVPFEQAGVEKAEELTANLEKWLPDYRDNKKWVMEEPLEDYEVPMAELPEELDDLIGDLIDDLDQMGEDTEDVTSGWMDSLDQGAGWGVADGPISNMSAKGKTGNMMPNSNEVGGRSGEGRSGQSSGQMVEKTAAGKGGRETPSRVTPDPYEAGSVKDTSGEQGGATGGGKKAGAGAQGLRGPAPPPETKHTIDRLSGKQAEIISKAEKLRRSLKKLRYNTQHLDSIVDDMKEVYSRMNDYAYHDYTKAVKGIRDNLKAFDTYIDVQSAVHREKQLEKGKKYTSAVPAPDMENLPKGYENMVKGYFRKLTE